MRLLLLYIVLHLRPPRLSREMRVPACPGTKVPLEPRENEEAVKGLYCSLVDPEFGGHWWRGSCVMSVEILAGFIATLGEMLSFVVLGHIVSPFVLTVIPRPRPSVAVGDLF